MLTLIASIVLLGVLVTVHELGHFIVAKLSGVRVEVFSIGFGRALIAKRVGETEYRISALPLGGYVRMSGQDAYDDEGRRVLPTVDDDRSLLSRGPLIRVLVYAAGPAMNLLLPFAILTPLFFFTTQLERVPNHLIGAVDMGLPAGKSGLLEGDAITAIDGAPVYAFWQIAAAVEGFDPDDGPLKFTVKREGQAAPLEIAITPEEVERTSVMGFSQRDYRIGYQPAFLAADVVLADPDGPAARAGVAHFDKIKSINGQPTPRYLDVTRALAALAPGATAPMIVTRAKPLFPEGAAAFIYDRQDIPLIYTASAPDPGLRHAGACVSDVDPTGPAAALKVGDCILAIDGQAHTLGAFIANALSHEPGQKHTLTIARGLERLEIPYTQEKITYDDPLAGEMTHWRAGLRLNFWPDSLVPLEMVPNVDRLGHAWYRAKAQIASDLQGTLQGLGGMFSGAVSPTQLSGPVTIFYLAGEHARAGLHQFLRLMVLLSISIALLNLLPIPGLDGGQILVAAIEGVIRRPLPDAFRDNLYRIGFVLILTLIIFALSNDLIRMWRISQG
ncbi:site-2 protease family protein [Myxococcota bacterium]|nr:site-2 protease family protein [Myxococcota bacterium]MBU1431209.1 site-2 protease family protein [Myxococcota bacterium]MBU1896800.1 site-2 protease family protein [Myxococcota bacterium]